METSPRYATFVLRSSARGMTIDVEDSLKEILRPGDRVVSVYNSHLSVDRVQLEVLVELRHPSWAERGVGFVAGADCDPASDPLLPGGRR